MGKLYLYLFSSSKSMLSLLRQLSTRRRSLVSAADAGAQQQTCWPLLLLSIDGTAVSMMCGCQEADELYAELVDGGRAACGRDNSPSAGTVHTCRQTVPAALWARIILLRGLINTCSPPFRSNFLFYHFSCYEFMH